MKCPRCNKIRNGLPPGKYECSNCGFRFEIKKETADNQYGNRKYINLIFGFIIFFSTIFYIYSAMNYEINEFHRPFFYLFIPMIIIFSVLFIFFSFILSQKRNVAENLIVGALTGFIVGSLCWLCLISSNYIFKSNVDLEYQLIKISQGKGRSLNFRIKTSNNEEFLLNIRTRNSQLLNQHNKLKIYRGFLGYYFGKISMLNNSFVGQIETQNPTIFWFEGE